MAEETQAAQAVRRLNKIRDRILYLLAALEAPEPTPAEQGLKGSQLVAYLAGSADGKIRVTKAIIRDVNDELIELIRQFGGRSP